MQEGGYDPKIAYLTRKRECKDCERKDAMIKQLETENDRLHKERTSITRLLGMLCISYGGKIRIEPRAIIELDIEHGVITQFEDPKDNSITFAYTIEKDKKTILYNLNKEEK